MGIERNPSGDSPQVSRTAYIHPTAVLIGNVFVGKKAFIGPFAVIRADEAADGRSVAPIILGDQVNVQDGVVIHALGGSEVWVGNESSLAHGALVHGPAVIGRNCFIGFKSIVFKAALGDGCVLQHGVIVENTALPADTCVPSGRILGEDADVARLPRVDQRLRAFAERVIMTNVDLVHRYNQCGALPEAAPAGPGRRKL